MTNKSMYDIRVKVESFYISEQSAPELRRYVFAYTVHIANVGSVQAKLLSRHWIISDGNGKIEEVKGPGVVGEHPDLKPGEEYSYTSGAMIETPVGTMRGSYQMMADDGVVFDAEIPQFTLSIPRTLH